MKATMRILATTLLALAAAPGALLAQYKLDEKRSASPDGLVEIFGVDQKIAAELLARLCKRAVGYEPFAVAHAHAARHCCRVQRVGSQIFPF